MDAYDTLTQYSSTQRNFTVANLPISDLVTYTFPDPVDALPLYMTKAYFTLKAGLDDADEDAIVNLSITTEATSSGMITDNGEGDGSGLLQFVIGNSALDSVTDFDRTYWASVKVIINNGNSFTLSTYPVKVLKSGVRAIS